MGFFSWLFPQATQAVTPIVVPTPEPADNSAACIAVILANEGGYVDNPNDSGGATNMGITEATLEDWRKAPVTKADVQNLSVAEATAIYRASYYPAGLPAGVDLVIMDAEVMSGAGTGAKLLQAALAVEQDGDIGPATLAAVKATDTATLIRAVSSRRRAFYAALVIRSPQDKVFYDGWMNRVTATNDKALAMVAA
jgi:lysozyme family protein